MFDRFIHSFALSLIDMHNKFDNLNSTTLLVTMTYIEINSKIEYLTEIQIKPK
jgi:hypothetical protein